MKTATVSASAIIAAENDVVAAAMSYWAAWAAPASHDFQSNLFTKCRKLRRLQVLDVESARKRGAQSGQEGPCCCGKTILTLESGPRMVGKMTHYRDTCVRTSSLDSMERGRLERFSLNRLEKNRRPR